MLLTEKEVRNRLARESLRGLSGIITESKKASEILEKSFRDQQSTLNKSKTYDIFLSHSTKDKELVAGTKLILEDLGYSVYIDWIEDPQMNRSTVSKETAELLQKRMQNCKCLFYAFSTNSGQSKWMPWECGYFDGIKNGKVAVLPISVNNDKSFKGTEYLGLYYYLTIQKSQAGPVRIYIRESEESYIVYEDWMNGIKPYKR
ncbi:toll/interleukin-1 receptor domain-containing protein [Emticicia sp. SJ17W-69]|uniref:toll/interleukin-1 receptor domain-containing protein n=1 Tax=Emticicia sp. SJ17W-69 TaxID=3421657 RepID=UPI003EBFDD8A